MTQSTGEQPRTDEEPRASIWAPFSRRAFRWLWLGVAVSNIGAWAQMVGAQWLFVNDPNAATIITLVQTASMLPVMLLALPAGVLADVFDRRWLLFAVQVYFIVIGVLLFVLTTLDLMPPALLLAFTFAIGVGLALQIPTWQPLIAELVPRSQLAAATRLDILSVNIARAAGPALAGVIIAAWGVAPVFAMNAVCVVLLAGILLRWRRAPAVSRVRERFLPALLTGGRYVRHEPVVRLILIRVALFVAPGSALWALLPLIANRQLGLGASGYGLLFAALGVGAVAGTLSLGRVNARLAANTLLAIAGATYAVVFALLMVAPSLWVAIPLLVIAGFGWTANLSTFNAELQLFLPGWVRARGIAVYVMMFTGVQAIAAPIWGLITQHAGLTVAVLIAAGLVLVGVGAGFVLRLPESGKLDRAPLIYWDSPSLGVDPEPDAGPIMVSVDYTVRPEDEERFVAVMAELRRSRLRSGGTRWDLFRVGGSPDTFVGIFSVPSWEEHERQHEGRLTAADKAIEDAVRALLAEPAKGRHLLPPAARTPD
ncbi:MAG: MFS transporter [Micropruina sp.]|nr:MFS transporter [Micropruina sp.]